MLLYFDPVVDSSTPRPDVAVTLINAFAAIGRAGTSLLYPEFYIFLPYFFFNFLRLGFIELGLVVIPDYNDMTCSRGCQQVATVATAFYYSFWSLFVPLRWIHTSENHILHRSSPNTSFNDKEITELGGAAELHGQCPEVLVLSLILDDTRGILMVMLRH